MSNVLKSKSLFGVMIGAAVVALALVAIPALAYTHTVTLKMGSTGAQVMSLQQALNAAGFTVATSGAGSPGMESTYFGAKTKAAVMSFQAAHGLTADGVVGPMTGAALSGSVSGGGSTGGALCPNGNLLSNNCMPASGGSSGALTGGAGDADITNLTSGTKDSIKEGATEKVLGFNVEAQDSDIQVSSVKVDLWADDTSVGAGDASENLSRYAGSVEVWMGDKKVGSADVSDFSKDSNNSDNSTDLFSRSISLSNAIVREGDKTKFYVTVEANDDIDTVNIDNAEWTAELASLRFNDATGAILIGDVSDVDSQTFMFEDRSGDDDINVKSSSANPDDATVQVDEHSTTDDVLALAFKLDVPDDSSDVDVTNMSFDLDLANCGCSSVEDVIDSVTVKVGSDEFSADMDTDSGDNDTSEYSVDIDSGDLTVNSGDTVDVKVYISFADQGTSEDNYDNNTTVQLSLTSIDAETSEDEIPNGSISGQSKTGALLTLSTDAADVSGYKWTVNSAGTIVDFFFTVDATNDDFDVLAADISDSIAGTATVNTSAGSPDTSNGGVLSKYSGDDVDTISGGFTVPEGSTSTFRLRYNLTGANGTWKEITVDSVAGNTVPDDKQTSPTATLNVSS